MLNTEEIEFLKKSLHTNEFKILKEIKSNNEDYVVNVDFGIIFLKKMINIDKYYNEFFFQTLLHSIGVPVSKIFLYSEKFRILVFEYVEGIRGDMLITRGKGKEVFKQMGELLKKIHSFEFKNPYIIGSLPVKNNSYIKTKILQLVEEEKKFILSKVEKSEKFSKILEKSKEIDFDNSLIRICHNDYQPTNIIFSESGEIVNLCDFEISSIFDFEYDLARVDFLNSDLPGFEYFWKGYGNYEKNEKFYFYRLISILSYFKSLVEKNKKNVDISYLVEYIFENYEKIGSHKLRSMVNEFGSNKN